MSANRPDGAGLSNRDIPRALLRLVPGARRYLALAVSAALLAAALLIVQVFLLSRIVGDVLFHHDGLADVTSLMLLTAGIMALRSILTFVREAAAGRAAIRVKTDIRRQLVTEWMSLGYDPTSEAGTAGLVLTATDGIEKLDPYVSRYLPQSILGVAVPVVIACAVFPVDPLSTALLIFTVPIIVGLMVLIGTFTRDHVQRQWDTLGRLGTSFLDVIQGLPTLLLLDRAESERERVSSINGRFRDTTLRVLRVAFLSGAVLELMSSAGIGLVATVLGVHLLDDGIPFDRAFYVFLLTPEFYRPLRDLGAFRHAAMEGLPAANHVLGILRAGRQRTEPSARIPPPRGPLSLQFHDVGFTYEARDTPALQSVNLSLPAGTCTAVIGANGVGKTTLIQLLLRYIQPAEGDITCNGIPLASMSVEDWRAQVALVPQHPYLFTGTIRDNIRLARPSASEDEMQHAAHLADCTAFIDELPEGMETLIGENGEGLSTGQRQRLAVARAFLKDAPILLLDEPTSALDPESELQIRRALRLLMHGRTVLVIAHRLNTIAVADRIVVLDRGRVVEEGSPENLIRNEGVYASLVGAPRRKEVSA